MMNTPSDLNECRILLVDDNDWQAEYIKGMLDDVHASVEVVHGGEAAIELLKKGGQSFSCVLMEVDMQGMDGLKTAHAIREIDSQDMQLLPIVGLLHDATDERCGDVIAAGMNGWLQKPVMPPDLYEAVEHYRHVTFLGQNGVMDDFSQLTACVLTTKKADGKELAGILRSHGVSVVAFQTFNDVLSYFENNEPVDFMFVEWPADEHGDSGLVSRVSHFCVNGFKHMIVLSQKWDAIESEAAGLPIAANMSLPLSQYKVLNVLQKVLQDATEAEGHREAIDYTGCKVLIVDDNEMTGMVLQNAVAGLGADTEIVENGEEALNVLSASKVGEYFLVFMDIFLPGMRGPEVAAAFRALDRADATTLPIIGISGNSGIAMVDEAASSGMNALLLKPIKRHILLKYMELFFKEKRDGGAITARMQKELKDLQSRNRGLLIEAANEKFSTALLRHSVMSENFDVFLNKVHMELYKARSDCGRIVWMTVDEKGVVAMGPDSYRSPKDEAPQAVTDALLAWCREAVPRLRENGKFILAQGEDLEECRKAEGWTYGALLLVPVQINMTLCGMLLLVLDSEIIRDETIDVRSRILSDTLSLTLVQDRQRKALERERDRAVAAERTKSNFFAQVSHDIRTPLNAVIGYADLLRSGNCENGKEHEYYENIMLCGNALLNLINNVLDLNKLGAGQMEVSPETVDFAKMANEAMRIFSLDAKAKNLCMSCEVGNMPQLDLDKKHVLRILVNFLSNGVKYTNAGGVKLRAAFHEDTSDTGTLRFEVEDTGIGIADDRQLEMLKPYEQTGVLQIRMEGTGLGLAISRSLVELMGGTMSLKSQLGKGSTFIVELPGVHYRKALSNSEPKPAEKANNCGDMSLLLVDDLDMNLRVLTAVCKKFGFKDIVTAHDGNEALEKMQQNHFQLVLSDIWMPNMDGFGLVEKIRQDESLKDIPVFAITADASSVKDARADLFTSIVLKPISVVKLQEIVDKAFG